MQFMYHDNPAGRHDSNLLIHKCLIFLELSFTNPLPATSEEFSAHHLNR